MAARKKKKAKYGCKIVTVCGKRRRLCFGKKGIKSNTPAGARKGATRKSTKRKTTKRKSKARCEFGVAKSGARKGKCLKSPRRKKSAGASRFYGAGMALNE